MNLQPYLLKQFDTELERSIERAQAVLEAERWKRRRLTDLPDFVRRIMLEA